LYVCVCPTPLAFTCLQAHTNIFQYVYALLYPHVHIIHIRTHARTHSYTLHAYTRTPTHTHTHTSFCFCFKFSYLGGNSFLRAWVEQQGELRRSPWLPDQLTPQLHPSAGSAGPLLFVTQYIVLILLAICLLWVTHFSVCRVQRTLLMCAKDTFDV
jgi:hypothetical protein